jgi:hypothetical protein
LTNSSKLSKIGMRKKKNNKRPVTVISISVAQVPSKLLSKLKKRLESKNGKTKKEKK